MDKINFIESDGIKKQHELHRWYYISLLAIITVFFLVASVQVMRIITLYNYKSTYSRQHQAIQLYNAHTTEYAQLEKKEQQLIDNINHIHAIIKKAGTHPLFFLESIVTKFPCTIESCTISRTSIQLKICCSNYPIITQIVDALQENSFFKHVELTELHSSNDILYATIAGERKKRA